MKGILLFWNRFDFRYLLLSSKRILILSLILPLTAYSLIHIQDFSSSSIRSCISSVQICSSLHYHRRNQSVKSSFPSSIPLSLYHQYKLRNFDRCIKLHAKSKKSSDDDKQEKTPSFIDRVNPLNKKKDNADVRSNSSGNNKLRKRNNDSNMKSTKKEGNPVSRFISKIGKNDKEKDKKTQPSTAAFDSEVALAAALAGRDLDIRKTKEIKPVKETKQQQILREKIIAADAARKKKAMEQRGRELNYKKFVEKQNSLRQKNDRGDVEEEIDQSIMSKVASSNIVSNVQSFVSKSVDSIFKGGGNQAQWEVVCPKTRISPGEVVPVVVGGIDLLIIASKDARDLYCIANSCPHLGTPLETGQVQLRPIEKASSKGSETVVPTPSNVSGPDGLSSVKEGKCEECIVCPLHRTAFALESGEVRGEWCPYPPVIGKVMGNVKPKNKLATFETRAKGKNIEVRINTSIEEPSDRSEKKKGKKNQ